MVNRERFRLKEYEQKKSPYAIFLVRHGLSKGNVGLPSTSSRLVDLVNIGSEQALKVKQGIDLICREFEIKPDLMVYSPYLRAKLTAMPTLVEFNYIESIEDPRLREFTYLDFDGIESKPEDRKEARETYWRECDPSYRDFRGSGSAETFIEFITRVRDVLEEARKSGKIQFLFTHEQWIQAAGWLLKFSSRSYYEDPLKIKSETMREFRKYMLDKHNEVPNGGIAGVNFENETLDGLFAPLQYKDSSRKVITTSY